MRLSSMADYAVVTMAALTHHCGAASRSADGTRRARVSATDVAAETGLPLPTVQRVVTALSRAGLLRAARGAGGGLQLARPAAAITLADIVEAVEGPIALTPCVDADRADCAIDGTCTVKRHWPLVNEALRGALANISLMQLAAQKEMA